MDLIFEHINDLIEVNKGSNVMDSELYIKLIRLI